MSLATLCLGNSSHNLVNVLAATSPGNFSAFAAGNLLAHFSVSFSY
jgi:hypothetical protein